MLKHFWGKWMPNLWAPVPLFAGVFGAIFVGEILIALIEGLRGPALWLYASEHAFRLFLVVAPVLYLLGMREARRQIHALRATQQRLRKGAEQLDELNQTFLSMGTNHVENIERLVQCAGKMTRATSALFNVLREDKLITEAVYNEPLNYNRVTPAEGHLCNDLIKRGRDGGIFSVNDLQHSPYLESDTNVKAYGLSRYLGYPVLMNGQCMGSLCVVFQQEDSEQAGQERLLMILAQMIGVELELKQHLDKIHLRARGLRELYEVISATDLTLEQKVQQLLELGCRRLGMQIGILSDIADEQYVVRAVHGGGDAILPEMVFELSNTYCEQTIREGHPVGFVHASDDPAWQQHPCFRNTSLESYIGTIYSSGNQIKGTLNFASKDVRDHAFEEADFVFVRLMSQWLSGALRRQENDEALREGQNRLELALAGGDLGLWDWDVSSGAIVINDRWAEMLGYKPGELEMNVETWERLLHPEDRDMVMKQVQAHLRGENERYESVQRLQHKTGTWRWVLDRGRVVERDAQGNALRVAGTHLDITERKQAEAQLAAARKQEVDIASRIQRTLLLGRAREYVMGVQAATLSVPSRQVDGDFYDCFVMRQDCMDIVVGDVMGKGVPAALLGAATKNALVRSLSKMIAEEGQTSLPEPREIITSLHAGMARELIDLNSFVTLCYARVDGRTRELTFVDCGHTRMVLYRAVTGSCELLAGSNMPLGFSAREIYEQQTVQLDVGDMLVFYSDGITEAANADGELFGEERLQQTVKEHAGKTPQYLLDAVHDEVRAFAGQDQFRDDVTCVTVKIDAHWASQMLGERTYCYEARTDQLTVMRTDLTAFMQQHYTATAQEAGRNQVLLAVNEAMTNIIQHAYGKDEHGQVLLQVIARKQQLEVVLKHDGAAFAGSVAVLAPPDGSLASGYGMYMMEAGMDAVHYGREKGGKNYIRMIKTLG